MYQRVQRVECSSPRPVLVMGPLVESSKEMLVKETPAKFCRCLPGELVHKSLVRVYLFMKDLFVSLISYEELLRRSKIRLWNERD